MKRKYYTKKQRITYGLGWFAISFVVGFIFQSLNWIILSYIAYVFGALSLYTGFFSTNDPNPPQPGEFTPEDFDNPADYADNIYRVLKSIKKDLLDIQKKNKGKLTKKNILSYINDFKKSHTIRVGGFESFEKQIKGSSLMFVITPELEPFCVQFFLYELPKRFEIEIWSNPGGKYEGFTARIQSDSKDIIINIQSDTFPETPTKATKKLNKILLKNKDVLDDELIPNPARDFYKKMYKIKKKKKI